MSFMPNIFKLYFTSLSNLKGKYWFVARYVFGIRTFFGYIVKALQTFTEENYRTINSIFSLMISQCQGFDKAVRKRANFSHKDVSLILSVHWANTISMLEIASRLEKPYSISFFRSREQKYKTLKNILVCIMLFTFVIGKPSMEFEPYPQQPDTVWNQNQLFQYIVRSALFSPVSLRQTVTEALTTFSRQFLRDFLQGLSDAEQVTKLYAKASKIGDVLKVSEQMLFALRTISDVRMEGLDSESIIYDLAYTFLLKSLLPTIRRCLVFIKVLHELVKILKMKRWLSTVMKLKKNWNSKIPPSLSIRH